MRTRQLTQLIDPARLARLKALCVQLVEYGTQGYPAEVRTRLKILNVVAYLIAISTLVYAIQYALKGFAKFAPVVYLNLAIVAAAALVPFAHRFSDIAGALMIALSEFAALFVFTMMLGPSSGIQVQYFAAPAAFFVIFGLERVRLVLLLTVLGAALHLIAWLALSDETALIKVGEGELNSLYVTATLTTFTMIAAVVYYAFRLAEQARAETEALLRNILPEPIVDRLRAAPDAVLADSFQEASVLFADLKGFVSIAKSLGPERTVALLNEMMQRFDRLAAAHGAEKIKTIGDAYMAAAGVPEPVADHAPRLARLGARHGGYGGPAVARTRCAPQPAHRHRLRPGDGRRYRRQTPHLRCMGRHGEPGITAGGPKPARPRAGGQGHQGPPRRPLRPGTRRQHRPQRLWRRAGLVPKTAWTQVEESSNSYRRSPRSSLGTSPVRPEASATKNCLRPGMRSTRPRPKSRSVRRGVRSLEKRRLRPSKAAAESAEFEPPPALVALEHGERANVEAETRRVDHDFGQRGHVAKAQVEALAGDRVHAVRGIADEREAIRHQRAGEMHVERPGAARASELHRAQPPVETPLDLGQECRVVERDDLAPALFLFRPGDARAVAGERQQRERTGGQEMLHGPAAVGLGMAHGGEDAELGIAPAHHLDAGGLAQARAASVGGNEQRRAQRPASGERDVHAVLVSGKSVHAAAAEQRDPRPRRRAGDQRIEQPVVLDDPGGGLAIHAIVVGDEDRAKGIVEARVGDVDRRHRLGMPGNRRPDAEQGEHVLGAGRQREGASITRRPAPRAPSDRQRRCACPGQARRRARRRAPAPRCRRLRRRCRSGRSPRSIPFAPVANLTLAAPGLTGHRTGPPLSRSRTDRCAMPPKAAETPSALDNLMSILDLETLEENLFRGRSPQQGWQRVFGGQVLGQALVAAVRTTPPERIAHSMHAYFLLPGDPSRPIVYNVERVRDGGSFSTRRVTGIQHGRAMFVMSVSFHKEEPGLDHQSPMPDVPPPEDLPSEYVLEDQLIAHLPENMKSYWERERPIELRPIDVSRYFDRQKHAPTQSIWLRASGQLPDAFPLHQCVLAYASDFTLLDTALIPHGKLMFDPDMQMASLDHALWFHRPFRADEWLLYVQDSPSSHGARGFCRGTVFTRSGTLIASVAQEGLLRQRQPAPVPSRQA